MDDRGRRAFQHVRFPPHVNQICTTHFWIASGQYTHFMRIPHSLLSSAALRAVVEEFVTRDGTDHTSVEQRIQEVLRHLEVGRVALHFDDTTKTCNILVAENGENPPADHEGE